MSGRDPAHPWIGEAVALDYANNIDGTPLPDFGDAIRYRQADGGQTSTLAAGESFMAGFFDSEVLLSGDDAVFTFAVVCGPSSSGTLRLSGGVDPDFALDDPGDASQSLGTVAVSGEQVAVSDPLTRDVDDYLTQSVETVVFVECLSGSVVVEQIKMRIWPPGGVAGAWQSAPGFTVDVAVGGVHLVSPATSFDTGLITTGSAAGAWDTAAAELIDNATNRDLSSTDPDFAFPAATVQAALGVAQDIAIPGTWNASGIGGASGSVVQQPDPEQIARANTPNVPAGVYGLDYAWPPDEVPGDWGVEFSEEPSTAWGAATVETTAYTAQPHGDGGSPIYTWTAVPDEAMADPTTLALPATGTPIPALGVSTSTTPPDSRTALLSIWHPILSTAPAHVDMGGGGYQLGILDASIAVTLDDSTVTVPAYLYWAPLAVAYRPLRQWPLDEGNGGTPPRYGGKSTSRLTSKNARGYQ